MGFAINSILVNRQNTAKLKLKWYCKTTLKVDDKVSKMDQTRLALIGRQEPLFQSDERLVTDEMSNIIANSSFLVLGGAGSIGQAVVKLLFSHQPQRLIVVDINENNLTELVRDVRNSFGYISGEFETYALDIGSIAFDALVQSLGQIDYVLNLSALKHVRSEKDPYTLMRMIDVNIFNTEKTIKQAVGLQAKKYFCVSTDKATKPVNMMGASKRIMERYLMHYSEQIDISTARFANVAFSDGSLLHSFEQRMQKQQAIAAPDDVTRYFITDVEAGQLCVFSCLFGNNRDIFFPKPSEHLTLTTFSSIAKKFIQAKGYQIQECQSEQQARSYLSNHDNTNAWPLLLTKSDTSGEKMFEEFYSESDQLDLSRFDEIGVVKASNVDSVDVLDNFSNKVKALKSKGHWTKAQLVDLFNQVLDDFDHQETGKSLHQKM